MPTTPLSLTDKYVLDERSSFMTGIQALVRLPLEQHRRDKQAGRDTAVFISGYQGSPLGTYDMELQRVQALLEEHQVVFQAGLNEELAATAVMGSQLVEKVGQLRYDGVCGIWYGKAPGVDRAGDALRHANLMGVPATGGAVVLAGDDPTAKSSTLPCASETMLHSIGIPVLYPGTVQEVLDFGIHAFAMSRCSGLWAGLKIVTSVADGSATVNLDLERLSPQPVALEDAGNVVQHRPNGILLGQTVLNMERSLWNNRLDAARRYISANGLNRIDNHAPDARVGIVAPGKSYIDVLEALRRLGLHGDGVAEAGIRLLKVGAPFPLDPSLVRVFAQGLTEIIVIEEKHPFVESFVKDALYAVTERPAVVGKYDESGAVFMPFEGEGSADLLATLFEPRLRNAGMALRTTRRQDRIELPLLAVNGSSLSRTPYFCSGCPHNISTKVPDGSLVGAGIGCHGLVMLMDEKQVGNVVGVTQMGGEGAQWIGMSHFTEVPHLFQDIGDGTFMHSGSLAIRAAVASGVNITYKLLYNSAVAMTGGQSPVGEMTVPQIVRLLLAEGVAKVIVTTEDTSRYRKVKLPSGVEVLDRSRLIEAEARLAKIAGVTVLLHDQECAAEKRRKRKRGRLDDPAKRIFINERVCEGCGDCGEKSNCLSVEPVETEFGRKTAINQSSCNKDYSCLEGDCPSFVEVIPNKRRSKPSVAAIDGESLPSPVPTVSDKEFAIRIAGIGGTGIVTVAQVIATAASLDGWSVLGLDQTGIAQKGGPVISDLRFTKGDQPRSNKLASQDCDLYLACDVLVGADPANLKVADPARSTAVVSSAVVPTGAMVIDTAVSFPPLDELQQSIARHARPDGMHLVDSRAVTTALFGSSQSENLFLVGVAFQAGALPISASSIEAAITLNGVAVDSNVQAFRRGRQHVADPATLQRLVKKQSRSRGVVERPDRIAKARQLLAGTGVEPGSELHAVLQIRVAELIEYQNVKYATTYLENVERARRWEVALPRAGTDFAEGVAKNLFKLMAYKDEAEVARLSINGELQRAIAEEFGPDVRAAWKLHPPVLRAMGMKRKITLGPWAAPAFRVLYAMRHLRGTPVNPFGVGAVRRLERDLIRQYVEGLDTIIAVATADEYAIAVEIAGLPDMIRGYEHVKLGNVEKYQQRRDALFEGLGRRQRDLTVVK
jgi:indolepyruvate ferredoxin oxidoreductase